MAKTKPVLKARCVLSRRGETAGYTGGAVRTSFAGRTPSGDGTINHKKFPCKQYGPF